MDAPKRYANKTTCVYIYIYIFIYIYIYIVYIILYQCNNQRMSSETSWGSNGWYIRNIKKYYNQYGLSKGSLTKKVENNWESTKKNTAGMKQLLFFQVLYCTSGLADVGGLNLGQAIMFTQPLCLGHDTMHAVEINALVRCLLAHLWRLSIGQWHSRTFLVEGLLFLCIVQIFGLLIHLLILSMAIGGFVKVLPLIKWWINYLETLKYIKITSKAANPEIPFSNKSIYSPSPPQFPLAPQQRCHLWEPGKGATAQAGSKFGYLSTLKMYRGVAKSWPIKNIIGLPNIQPVKLRWFIFIE